MRGPASLEATGGQVTGGRCWPMGLRSVVDQHFQQAPLNGVERWGTLVGPSLFLPLEMPTGQRSLNHQLDEETLGGRRQRE